MVVLALMMPVAAVSAPMTCVAGPSEAAAANAASLETLEWAPFRRPERGWAIYATRIAAEIGTRCPAMSPGFAAALADWQGEHRLPATGVVDIPGFAVMNAKWTLARPFVMATRGGNCPLPADAAVLAVAAPTESYGGKTIVLHVGALAAYRRMMAAARRQLPLGEPDRFRIFSGFRAPEADDLRCAVDGNCQGIVRAACSAHRTGMAIDMHVGAAAGFGPDSSDDGNRRAMVRTLGYRWLVANAARFGFVNYVFEPWHWEWSPPSTSAAATGKTPP